MSIRILLTVIAVVNIFADCYNDTIKIDDGRIYITLDFFKILAIVGFWVV